MGPDQWSRIGVFYMSEYWAYTWLDSHKIRTIDELKASLASSDILYELKQAAELVVESWRSSHVEARPLSLIAGAGIDLSGRLDCNATSCRRAQVDRVFRRAWHYFQTIVARDAIAEDLTLHKNCPDAELRSLLPPHFETVLIVRELGAEALVEFLPRVPPASNIGNSMRRKQALKMSQTERQKLLIDWFPRPASSCGGRPIALYAH